MIKKKVDIDALLIPIPGENPAGENLRYDKVYDEIKEARREDDVSEQGDWKHEIKKAEWNKVIDASVNALTSRTKDVQIAVWLMEALIKVEGFAGLSAGLKLLTGLLKSYWERVYPEIENGDLEFRIGILEIINDKISISVKQIPLTDIRTTPGYSLLKWTESRQVGYEKNTRNQYGEVDENKKKRRDEMIADGKLTAEDCDAAIDTSKGEYYVALEENLRLCRMAFDDFEKIVDEKFGSHAPRLAEFRKTLEELGQFIASEMVVGLLASEKEKREIQQEEAQKRGGDVASQSDKNSVEEQPAIQPSAGIPPELCAPNQTSDSESLEKNVWEGALRKLKDGGIKEALGQIYTASCSMPSARGKNRFKLIMAKVCLKAKRHDLARPILEEIYALIQELQLERWESPVWIGEIHDALYQCLIAGKPSDADMNRANELFKKICTIDITKAITY